MLTRNCPVGIVDVALRDTEKILYFRILVRKMDTVSSWKFTYPRENYILDILALLRTYLRCIHSKHTAN